MMQSLAGGPWLVVAGAPAVSLLSAAATKLVTKNTTAMTAIKKSTSRDLPVVLIAASIAGVVCMLFCHDF
jgi:hypothetical protein